MIVIGGMKMKFFNRNLFGNQTNSKLWTLLLLIIGGLGVMSGCAHTQPYGSLVAMSNAVLVEPDKVGIKPDKSANLDPVVNQNAQAVIKSLQSKTGAITKTAKVKNKNCTIRQYAARKVRSERLYCEIEGDDKLNLYTKPDESSVAWMDLSKQVYVFNHEQVNSTLVVNGKIKVKENSWEFIPQRNPFLIGPKRVEVVLDKK